MPIVQPNCIPEALPDNVKVAMLAQDEQSNVHHENHPDSRSETRGTNGGRVNEQACQTPRRRVGRGNDERIRLDALRCSIEFYTRLMRQC